MHINISRFCNELLHQYWFLCTPIVNRDCVPSFIIDEIIQPEKATKFLVVDRLATCPVLDVITTHNAPSGGVMVALEPINIWHCPSHHLQINLIAYFDFLPDNAGLTPHIDFVMLADVTLRNIFQPANVCIFSPLWTLQIKLSRVCSFCDERQNNLAMPLFHAFKCNSYGSENPVLILYKILLEIMIMSN